MAVLGVVRVRLPWRSSGSYTNGRACCSPASVIAAFSIGMYGEQKGYFARTAYTLLAVLYIGKLLTYFVFIRADTGQRNVDDVST